MRVLYTILLSIFTYIVIFLCLNIFVDAGKGRRHFYHYPDGFILHADHANGHLVGYNAKTDRLPQIQLEDDVNPENIVLDIKSSNLIYWDFWYFFILSYILFLSGFLFLFRMGDILFALFFIISSLFVLSNIFLLGFDSNYFLFYLTFFQLAFLIVNLTFRIKGRETPSKWYILEFCLSLLFAIVGSRSSTNEIIFKNLTNIAVAIILFASGGLLAVGIYDNIKYYSKESKENFILKKLILSLSVFLMVGLFFISTKYDLMRDYPFFKFINLIVIFSFPFFFIYSSYGYTYIPQQIFFSSFITIFYQLITVGLLYAVYFLSLNIILPESILSEISEYLPYLFLLIIITFSTNLRNLLINGLEYISAKKNRKLNHSLEEMIRLISSPVSMKVSIDKLVRIAMNALEVQKVVILITDERIKSTQKATPFIMKISRQSGIWKYLANETEITITSHLAYGAGYREQVFNFLDNMKIHLAYPIFGIEGLDEPSTVFLFGEKRNKRNFSIAELKFMKEFAKLGDMMLQNYLLLISEIEKKRLEKDIELASLQQRTMNTLLDSTRIDGIELGHMSIPAMGVSGDYLDYIPFPKSVKIFLGDVSGHGVGSGYLVSAIKALVREQIRLEIGLNKLFEHLNNFLLQRHAGNQFMSLVGGEYYFEDSRFEFVNAGHLYPILLRREGSVEYLKTPDRVIGVLPTVFQKDSVTLETGDRLVIFSDGITETFSPAEEIFGIARLEKCIRECRHLNSFELITKIKSELDDYRKGASLTDDISIICLTKL